MVEYESLQKRATAHKLITKHESGIKMFRFLRKSLNCYTWEVQMFETISGCPVANESETGRCNVNIIFFFQ